LASELDARILDLQIGEPVMLVRGVTYLRDGRAIELQESHFRAESIEFIIELGEYSKYARLTARLDPAQKVNGHEVGRICGRILSRRHYSRKFPPRFSNEFRVFRDGFYL
jgi:hypothetical protein